MGNTSFKNKKITAFILFLLYIGGVALLAQNVPKSYVAQITTDSIIVDGKAGEDSWQRAVWSDSYTDIEGVKTPKFRTRMKMVWDRQYLYFYAELEEPHVWATLKERDTIIFYNNDFEIFIDPDGDTHNYYEFEMNALNTVWDLFISKPYRNNGKVLGAWDFKGIKTAVDVQGTLNDPSDTDKGWSVEIAIPWSFVTEPGGRTKVPENEFWRLNFSRVNWDFDLKDGTYSRKKDPATHKFLPEYNWVWSPQGVINMHEPEHWGYVYFSTSKVGQKATFEIPKDEHIKWFLYGLFRKYRSRTDDKTEFTMDSQEILGKTVEPKLETYPFGWTIWAKSPFSEKVLGVTQDGNFIQ
ncbi:MAG: carbohydrate-binding family 9-like protein [Sediminicola sp.]